MKMLYYSTSYYANHGGSIQSIEFFSQLEFNKEITDKAIYPVLKIQNKSDSLSGFSLREFLRKIPILQVLFFYRRNTFHINGLIKKIKDFQPDALLIQIDSNFLQIETLKNKFPDLIIANQINGSPFDEPFKNIAFKDYFLKKQRKSYENSNINFFISDFSRDRIMGDHIRMERDIVIHNGTDPDKFFPIDNKSHLRNKWNYPKDKFVIGYIGTLDFHKQLGILLDVFADLMPKYPNLFLVIIGNGPDLNKLKQQIKNLGLAENVQLRGWLQHEEINENLNCFDLAVHHYANTYMNPLKIFEYLSAGLPVIAPDIPSVRSIFKNRIDLLITGSSHEEVKSSIKELLDDSQLRESISNNEHLIHEIEGNYTWKKYTNRIVQEIKRKL